MGTIPNGTNKIFKNRILNSNYPGWEFNVNKIHRANYFPLKKWSSTPSSFDGSCNKCLEEKIQIMLYIGPVKPLNKKCDFIARCRHRNKFRLFAKVNY